MPTLTARPPQLGCTSAALCLRTLQSDALPPLSPADPPLTPAFFLDARAQT